MNRLFDRLLAGSTAAHGHLCPGQVVGVRMAMLGTRLVGLPLPHENNEIKKLLVYVEMDRCTADAVAHAAGVTLGRRSLKFVDYGIMAATFVNLETGAAYRVLSTEESRDLSDEYAPEIPDKAERQTEAYKRMPDHILFRVMEAEVDVSEYDLPGPTRKKAVCEHCGQVVRDNRETVSGGRVLCRPCAGNAYFRVLREVDVEKLTHDHSHLNHREPATGIRPFKVVNPK